LSADDLLPTACAICNTFGNADEVYPANFQLQALNPDIFSARRLPDRVHYRIVKCKTCGLVRSDPVASAEVLAQLYRQSTFTYSDEVESLNQTYGRYLRLLEARGITKHALLEIGCGNGFFLEEALRQGYDHVQGIEPSEAAAQGASAAVRTHIVTDVMRPGLFSESQFDVVCMFQVLDHIPDPGLLIKECLKIIKPGGWILCLNHNVSSWSARLLGEKSPIIDIEHTYLYDPRTIARLFEANGFRSRKVGAAFNRYSLHYLTRLLPLPKSVKDRLLAFMKSNVIGKMRFSVPLGNLFILAQKPFLERKS
jgi:SAM-dependent methyltransferase